MNLTNNFSLVGVVYEDIHYYTSESGLDVGTFFIVCNSYNQQGKVYIPITAFGSIVKTCVLLARKGNILAVDGSITSELFIDQESGKVSVRLNFVLDKIMLLFNAEPAMVNSTTQKIENILKMYDLE